MLDKRRLWTVRNRYGHSAQRRFAGRQGICAAALLAGLMTILPRAACGQGAAAVDVAAGLEKSIVAAIARAEKSVVAIARVRKSSDDDAKARLQVERGGRPRLRIGGEPLPTDPDFVPTEFGAGVVIDGSGLILTTYHVLGQIDQCDYYVWSNKRPFAATIKAADPYLDLAVLKVDAGDLSAIRFGSGGEVKKGQFAIVLGNPHAVARDGQPSAAWGIIAGVGRRPAGKEDQTGAREGKTQLHDYGTLLQFDARLLGGGSGGALLNLQGEMIGLTTALAAAGESAGGFAIPVDDFFLRAVEKLKAGKKVDLGFLGVAPENLSLALRQQGKQGARVYQAVPGTPASLAGLREVDVITHVSGTSVDDANALFLTLCRLPPGERVKLTVERGPATAAARPQVMQLEARLWKKANSSEAPVVGEDEFPAWRGLKVDYASAVSAFRDPGSEFDPRGCVGILAVDRDSPAWKAGLRSNMFLTHVGKTRCSGPTDFLSAVASQPGKVTLQVTTAGGGSPEHVVEPN